MSTLDFGIVNVALPTLMQSLHTSFPTIQWVALSYPLVSCSLVLGAARLGDMWGKKPLYLGGLVVFTLSSLLCGLASDAGWLIGSRILQGLGTVFISGLGLAIVTEVFPASERGRAIGVIGSVVSLGIALGPSIGGLLLGLVGWRSIFLVNVPIGLVATFLVARVVPSSQGQVVKQRFDLLGALLAVFILGSFSLGMTQGQRQGFGSSTSLGLLAVAALGLVCFLVVEARTQSPLLELRLFRNRQFSVSLLSGWLVYLVYGGSLLIAPFFLEFVKHYPTWKVGLLLAVPSVLSGLIAPIAGSLSDRFGSRPISLIGLVLMVSGCLAISTFDTQLTELGYVLRYALFGLGLGFFQSPNNSAVMGSVPRERLGIASGLLSLSRTSGATVGVPLLGAVFSALSGGLASDSGVVAAPPTAIVVGVQGTFHLAALILFVATATAAVAWRMEHRHP